LKEIEERLEKTVDEEKRRKKDEEESDQDTRVQSANGVTHDGRGMKRMEGERGERGEEEGGRKTEEGRRKAEYGKQNTKYGTRNTEHEREGTRSDERGPSDRTTPEAEELEGNERETLSATQLKEWNRRLELSPQLSS